MLANSIFDSPKLLESVQRTDADRSKRSPKCRVAPAQSTVGILTMEPPARLVDALAKSGGLNDFADDTKIFVLRQFPSFRRIRFKWEDILRNEGGAASFPLRSGDVIVVE